MSVWWWLLLAFWGVALLVGWAVCKAASDADDTLGYNEWDQWQ